MTQPGALTRPDLGAVDWGGRGELEEEFDWLSIPRVDALPVFQQTGVVGEIKPHTRSGISDGLAQLRKRFRESRADTAPPTRFLLVTYRPVGARIAVFLADPGSTTTAAQGKGRDKWETWRWHLLGTFGGVDLSERIPITDCPSKVGTKVEGRIRALYATKAGIRWLPKKPPSATGADIVHELAELLETQHAGDWETYRGILGLLRRELGSGRPDPRRLHRLLAAVPPTRALLLHRRLSRPRPDDTLASGFSRTLDRATRRALLTALLGRVPRG